MRTWARRVGVTGVIWGGLVAGMTAAEMDPRPLLLAAVAGALVLAVSLVYDVGWEPATPAAWPDVRVDRATSAGDARVHQLQGVIEAAISSNERVARLRDLLTSIADERVRAHHGVDRAAEPARYRTIVGDDVVTWLELGDSPVRVTRQELDGILRRIEAL